ncbi:MAG TPA: tripartite tricarboxylate transporter substrate binding protein [Burkholderiales bacterium]|nr:tripartite tricarboxylate transporter substrate binding protein [Burkholderiales bacterium]
MRRVRVAAGCGASGSAAGIRPFCFILPLALAGAAAHAEPPYPARALRLVVPSSPGGGADISARIIAPKLSEALGQQVVVENRPGASTMIGGEAVARAAPDGYTLLLGISTLAINPAIYRKIPYDALKDFAPVSQLVSLPNLLVTHPSLPVATVKELVALARARPGQIHYASAGVGTNPHFSMELFLSMAGLRMVHVPYKGSGRGIVEVIAGQVPVMMPSILAGLPHAKSGRLRALGVTSAKRAGGAPGIPTIAEAGVPGYEAVQWFGVLAPAATPREIVSRLHGEIVRALHSPEVRGRFAADGADPVGSTPEEFAAFLRAETAKWAKVAQEAGIRPE